MSSKHFACWSAITIFLSAFLLFQVQPVISKMILPWFGGGPAVWTTCMLFFQVLLLGGYAYAHLLVRGSHSFRPTLLHLILLGLALATLPITPAASWKPVDGWQPTSRILMLLAANIGLPYFLLSSTGPLIQAWYSRVLPAGSPYRLYALSNVGSLGALLTYPFFFEPRLTTNGQGALWSVMFAIFVLLCGGLAIATYLATRRSSSSATVVSPTTEDSGTSSAERAAPVDHRLAWLLLPALASMMLLAITNHVCQDIAVVPFLWIAPLGLYLLSFILCFDRPLWYRRRAFGLATMTAIAGLCYLLAEDAVEQALMSCCELIAQPVGWFSDDLAERLRNLVFDFSWSDHLDQLAVEAGAFLLVLFLICMVCHGELTRLKPPPQKLTSFYLMVAAGGAMGGICVALVGPQVFSTYLEMNIGLVAAFMLTVGVVWDDAWQSWFLNRLWKRCLGFVVGFVMLLVVVRAQFESVNSDAVVSLRNFYGVLAVEELYDDEPDFHIRQLMNGRILHGSQFLDAQKRQQPTTYYNQESGIGIALRNYFSNEPLRVAVVGLGTGSIAAYGGADDYYCFYEINPNVRRLAYEYFSYLEDSPADVEVKLGDARITMERESPQAYDVIALDAFSSDAIPAHLLTKEAFTQYLRHFKSTGVIAIHISNRHLDLVPIVGGLAKQFDMRAVSIEYLDEDYVGEAGSDWVLITNNTDFLQARAVASAAQSLEGFKFVPLWTDQYSNLLQILHWD